MAQVAELATKFSFTGSLKPLDTLNSGLTSAIGTITKVTGVLTVAGVALGGFIVNTLAGADAQIQLSRETGVAIEEMQKWGYIASVNGGSAAALESSIVGLSQRIGEAANGAGEGVEVFSRLGISLRDSNGKVKNADAVLGDLQGRLSKFSQSEKISILNKLGIDKSMLQTLQLSSDEMSKLMSKAEMLGVISGEDANSIASFNDSLTTLKFGLDTVQKRMAIAFAPQLTNLADGFTDLLVANKDAIQNGLKKFFELVNTGLGAIFKFGKLIIDLIDGTVGLENAFMIAATAMLWLNRAMILNPVGAIIAGITALIIIFDDLTVGLAGGQSVIADWFQEWFNIDILSVIRNIGEVFSNLVELIGSVVGLIASTFQAGFDNIVSIFKFFTGQISFSEMVSDMQNSFEGLLGPIKRVVDALIEYFQPLLNIFKSVTDFEMPSWSSLNPFSDDNETKPKDTVSRGISSPIKPEPIVKKNINFEMPSLKKERNDTVMNATKVASPNVPNNVQNSSNVNNNITIEIKTDNPQLAGQQVNTELQSMLNNANVQFNKGGR